MIKTYVTFGQVHVHSVNGITIDKDCVVVIERETAEEGRDRAFELFGPKFFTTYPQDHWEENSMEYFPRGYIKLN